VFNLQGSEIIVILLLALVVLGPDKLPDAIRKFSRTYADFKKMSSGFQSELKSALDEPMREMRETAEMVRDAADPRKVADEAEAEARLRRDADRVHPDPIEAESSASETPDTADTPEAPHTTDTPHTDTPHTSGAPDAERSPRRPGTETSPGTAPGTGTDIAPDADDLAS
jgi:sec-independent protein translocase protein TatB